MFSIKMEEEISDIVIARDDLILSGRGVFSFSKENLLNPNYKQVDSDLNLKNISYVLANYNLSKINENDWVFANINFDLRKAYREDGKYGFLISVPGLKVEDNLGCGVEISEIRVDLEGRSLLNKILSIF